MLGRALQNSKALASISMTLSGMGNAAAQAIAASLANNLRLHRWALRFGPVCGSVTDLKRDRISARAVATALASSYGNAQMRASDLSKTEQHKNDAPTLLRPQCRHYDKGITNEADGDEGRQRQHQNDSTITPTPT